MTLRLFPCGLEHEMIVMRIKMTAATIARNIQGAIKPGFGSHETSEGNLACTPPNDLLERLIPKCHISWTKTASYQLR